MNDRYRSFGSGFSLSRSASHRSLIIIATLLLAPQFAVAVDSLRPHAMVRPIPLGEVRWTEGFWGDRFATCRDRSLPAMWAIMNGTKYKPFLENFRIAAGDVEGNYHGAPFNDGDFYKFLEAVCAIYIQTQDTELLTILDESIDVIARAQRADGYIHTPVLVRERNGDQSVAPFSDRNDFEVYNMGHLMTAAAMHHQATGQREFLDVACKATEFLGEAFENPTPEMARQSICPSHYMGLIDLYRATNEPRYLELAKKLVEMRDLVTGGGDDNQDRIPFAEQREIVGHAVRANYLCAGVADLYLETGDKQLRTPLVAMWQNMVREKMYITGGCGALYDGASPDGSENQSQITRIHQAYGRNYQLPNTTAHNETCAAIGSVFWNWRMFEATGEARYIDVLERALYNVVLAGVSLDGKDYFYTNPLRNVEPLPTSLRWSRTRAPFVTSYCCPPNVLRTIAEVNGYAFATTDDALWINIYGGNKLATTLGGQPLKLTQVSDFPWNGRVRVTVDECPDREFSMQLRIPAWAEGASIRVNNTRTEAQAKPGTYAELRRKWHAGDIVDLELPMSARLVEAHPLVEETRNQVAIERGPIVYSLESPDLPGGVRVQDVAIRADAALKDRFDAVLLGGVTIIETTGLATPPADWSAMLYRPLQVKSTQQIALRLIPYYAWSNRGPSEMTVWLPVILQ